MTISTTTSRQSYNGNGVTTVFSVPFRFFANSDLVVQLVTVSTGAATTLTLTTHYTVTGADEEDGGSLTMLTAPAVGQRLVIRRVIGSTQEVDYVAGDPFPAETHERALDRLTMLAQQGEEVNARALVFPAGDTASGELPEVATRASKLLGFNSSGDLVVSAPASGSAAELAIDLASTASGKGAALVGFSQSGAGAVPRTTEDKAREIVSIQDYGAVPDWNGTTGTQNTAFIQAAIDSFGGARGTVNIGRGSYRCDDQRIDIKNCNIIGESPIPNSGGGGSELYFGSLGGLYTTVGGNSAPLLKDFRVTSEISEWKTANGQTMIDLTGWNYPSMENITITGGEVCLQIQNGLSVESHYGNFRNVNINKGVKGIAVTGGLYAQTHSFFGGRIWDCVSAYVNEGTGAADISFYGTAFESEQAIVHEATATAAQTKWFGCRNESSSIPDVTVGLFVQVGTYWSGNRRQENVLVDPTGASGELTEYANRVVNIGVNHAIDAVAPNVLPNALFEFDPSVARTASTVVPGWVPFGATHYDSGKASEGNYIRLERQAASGTVGVTSKPFPLKKGKYIFGTGWKKDGYGVSGTIKIDLMVGGASFGAAGVYADIAAPITYGASEYDLGAIEILQDIPDFQFRVQCDASTNGRYFYIFQPVMAKGYRGASTAPVSPRSSYECDGAGPPTTGTWGVGVKVWNTTPTAGGNIGWVCTTAGSPGTWKTFGAIAA